MYKIAKENLSALFRMIAENQELYLPVKTAGQTNFKTWAEEAEVDLDTLKTVKSPKDAFFPQSENLYSVKKEGKKLHVEPEALKNQDFVGQFIRKFVKICIMLFGKNQSMSF